MKVTLRYFDDCPGWRVADERLRIALAQVGASAELANEVVDTPEKAAALGFQGSPTVLVDGRDPFWDASLETGLSCRLYDTGDGLEGSPSVAQLADALAIDAQEASMTAQTPARTTRPEALPEEGGFVDLLGRRFYRIADVDLLEPFFMTIVGSGDAWLFVSSTGGLTAGRIRPDTALFPYYTDDKIAESAGRTGGLTALRVSSPDGALTLWEPFAPTDETGRDRSRNLYKDAAGTALVFEECRADLGLRIRVTWQTSERFGIVRTCELANTGEASADIEMVDGFVNLLPAGVDVSVQSRLSNLLDAYKRSEIDEQTGLGIFSLSSRLTDLAEPSESLHANVAWQVGLEDVDHLASMRQLPRFHRGGQVQAESDVRGERGAYLVHARLGLGAGEVRSWSTVGDVEQDAADVTELRELLAGPDDVRSLLEADVDATRVGLERILATADARQSGGDELATAHHLANVLFNVMRGGVPVDGYRVEARDVRAFVSERSPVTAARCAAVVAALPDHLPIDDLLVWARNSGDLDLLRLALEYLPLTFSRRHGDPSRPWNTFEIALRDGNGDPRLSFQGNWRDIFQNWEALAWSFPEYLESMVTVFLDATTADGYNPYRISRSGIDWEVPEPDNPWANIGYWSDHQIVYLLRLLETSQRFHPGRLEGLLDVAAFTHADVPYRIASYEQTLVDPYETVTFDQGHAAAVDERVEREGPDGRLVHGPDGDLLRVTITEKLLTLLLAKMVNLVPDGGVWMNTQRPEWNDANNALVGRGLSVVTLAQLRRYVDFLRGLLTDDAHVSAELAQLAAAVTGALDAHRPDLEHGFTGIARRAFMDALGSAGTAYRARVYAGLSGERALVTRAEVASLLASAQSYLEASLRSNARADGLYHSYNLLELTEDAAGIRRLPEMLEGQVAVLASGQLTAEESLTLLTALRSSRLFRADQHSYVLYPDKDVPGFLSRNHFTAGRADACPLVGVLSEAGDRSLVVRDVHGDFHFAAGIRNARDVEAALDRLSADPDLQSSVAAGRAELLEIFEEVFNHAEFTGRSGSFFAYEGLGSIYWHMVSKLLLSAQETLERAVCDGESSSTVQALVDAYEDIRAGLGYCKSAEVYGAFPTDPYSHTPAGHGARQPGMTGQVKEEVLTRLGELGLRVEEGAIVFRPIQLRESEWTGTATQFDYLDVLGRERSLDLPADSLAFTFCQTPIVYRRAEILEVTVRMADGAELACPGGRVDLETSRSVFRRLGEVAMIEVRTPTAAAD